MGGNRRATQGWIVSIVTDKVRSDGDVSVAKLRKWLTKHYSVDIPYHRVFRGKEQAYSDTYGKWDDSFLRMNDFREELNNRNPGSVVKIDFEMIDDKKCFKRFFISLAACSKGFLAGCRPYISLDACHLKGKFNGVLAAATCIDGNNSIFPVAYSVLESENTSSWTWFLESLKKAIGTPDGLVISSDMQKGLEVAIMQHERLLKEMASVNEDAVKYLTINHNKLWSRSKFGTTCKCDYMTNNISEAFNSWVGTFRYQPVLDLLDNIREKILKRLDKKRRIVKKWNVTLVPMAKSYLRSISKASKLICKSNDNHAEVKRNGKRWQVVLDERKCSCRVWQVKGLPCVHASAFISFTRDNWEKYYDPYFTIEKFKDAYALGVATMPGKDQWVHIETGEKIYPPIIKRPAERPRKNRIIAADETKKRHRCKQCVQLGHRQKSCKNPSAQSFELGETSSTKRSRRKKAKGHERYDQPQYDQYYPPQQQQQPDDDDEE
ncbi:uncharacterized protein Tco_0155308 [Tanacetum coccineum]